MDKLDLNDTKQIEIDILNYIDEVCNENDIVYYLYGGTLLGAVRHKGFIPWDDDIDILVPIDQYHKLLDLLEKGSDKYSIFTMNNRADYPYCFAKCIDANTVIYEKNIPPIEGLGIYVDIFPLLFCPDGKIESRFFIKKLALLRNISWHGAMREFGGEIPQTLKGKLIRFLTHFISWRKAALHIEQKSMHFKNTISCIMPSNHTLRFLRSTFGSNHTTLFEGKAYSVPADCDAVLKSIYGKYMILPPEKNRVLKHDFEAYRK